MAVFFVCAGLLGLLAAILTLYVGRMRGQKKIWLGDGGDPQMTAAIRAHGNLLELAPFALLLLWIMHGPMGHRLADILAIVLVVARFLHAGGMLGFVPYGRPAGAIATAVIMAIAAISLIVAGLRAL
jgi:uncharacterized membrane protein YecN with MAPEG domain